MAIDCDDGGLDLDCLGGRIVHFMDYVLDVPVCILNMYHVMAG